MNQSVTTAAGASAEPPKQADVDALGDEFAGVLIQPSDAGYDEARAVFNRMIDRRPALIARCAGASDVAAALRFARGADLLVAVRGGGHSVAGHAVCDGGIVIDLSAMKKMTVDPVARTATAQAGVTWGEFDAATQAFGLATTGGRRTSTGIAGQTLGSGSGWLERKLGLTMDNLLSAEVVTAEGQLFRASESENDDLFWGLRGGGGNFGIVTSFVYRVHPVGPMVLGGMLFFPASSAPEVLRFWRDYMETAPDELGTAAALVTAPPEPFLPEHLRGRPAVALIVCYAGPLEEGEAVVQSLRRFGPPEADLVQPMPYTAVQTLIDEATPAGRCHYWKAENMAELTDAAIDVFVAQGREVSSPLTMLVLEAKGRAISRVGEYETALGNRDARYGLYAFSMWEHAGESTIHVAWTRQFMDAMAVFTTPGMSLNFTTDQDEARVRAFYGAPEKFERLVALKNEYDPYNVFRLNANIKPLPRVRDSRDARP